MLGAMTRGGRGRRSEVGRCEGVDTSTPLRKERECFLPSKKKVQREIALTQWSNSGQGYDDFLS